MGLSCRFSERKEQRQNLRRESFLQQKHLKLALIMIPLSLISLIKALIFRYLTRVLQRAEAGATEKILTKEGWTLVQRILFRNRLTARKFHTTTYWTLSLQ